MWNYYYAQKILNVKEVAHIYNHYIGFWNKTLGRFSHAEIIGIEIMICALWSESQDFCESGLKKLTNNKDLLHDSDPKKFCDYLCGWTI